MKGEDNMSNCCHLSTDINLPLNDNAKAVVEYYLSHTPYNQSKAYAAIFPSETRKRSTLDSYASEFFKNPRVKAYKEKRMKEMLEEANINAESIALRLGEIAWDKRDEATTSALKALDLLQKQLGLQNKNVQLNADVTAGVTIVDDYGTTDQDQ